MVSSKTYWRDKLSHEYAKAYDVFVSNISRGKPFVDFRAHDGTDLQKLPFAILMDCPQFFWLDPTGIRVMQSMRGINISFSEIFNKREIVAAQRSCDAAAAAVRGSSPLQIEKKIAEYLVRSVTYQQNDKLNQNMASALHFKNAQCSGIARAVKYLCDKNNVWCIEVNGTLSSDGVSGPHAWNIVNIDGKYYHLDVTSMLGANGDNPPVLRYMFFNCSDNEISKTHTWNRSEVPECKCEFQDIDNIIPNKNNFSTNNISKTSNVPVYSDMVELRSQIEKAGSQRRDKIEFNLSVGGEPQAQMKLISSSVNMVAPKISCSEYRIQYDGTKFVVTLSYRR